MKTGPKSTQKERPSLGRAKPVFRTTALEDEIIERITDGQTLRSICRLQHMPTWRSVYQWIDADPDLDARFAQARVRGHDAIAADALRIADTPKSGVETTVTNGVQSVKTVDMLGHRKLQIETRLKLLAKWDRRYGDRLAVTGGDGGAILIDESARVARIAQIMALGVARAAEDAPAGDEP